ncbi:hypothetical protein NDU88_003262 [Pleurodeles waltl]|uniref:Uncharacterized protein n=1 Tax=Pleurodeles waltl TaxID=8319 RepID=A0AAV7TN59_PLEWA|nr:hypothetical protein NDU88_003262 [Pleurodeles waltl]
MAAEKDALLPLCHPCLHHQPHSGSKSDTTLGSGWPTLLQQLRDCYWHLAHPNVLQLPDLGATPDHEAAKMTATHASATSLCSSHHEKQDSWGGTSPGGPLHPAMLQLPDSEVDHASGRQLQRQPVITRLTEMSLRTCQCSPAGPSTESSSIGRVPCATSASVSITALGRPPPPVFLKPPGHLS